MIVLKTKDKQEYLEHQLGHVNVDQEYDLSPWHQQLVDGEHRYSKYIASPLVDIGTRNGMLIKELADKGFDTYGIEITDAYKLAQEKRGDKVIQGDIQEGTSWPDKFFKSAVITHCLEHLDKPYEAMAEIKRILDGYLLICVPTQSDDPATMEEEGVKHGHHTFFADMKDITNFVESCGFEVVETERESPPVNWVVCKPQSESYWEGVFQGQHGYHYSEESASQEEIAKHIAANDTVLDLACGAGGLARFLSGSYTGVDYSVTAIKYAKEKNPQGNFMLGDLRNLNTLFKDNEYDVVTIRHALENQEDWKEVVRQAFRICNKKVIIVMKRPFDSSRLIQQFDNTWVWDIDYEDFNSVARQLSTSVSFGKINGEELVVINKHMDKVVFDLDDECDETSALPDLLTLKDRFPRLKVTLFCIPSKCSPEHIAKLQQYDFIELGVHGFFHDTEHGRAQESNYWTTEEANKYLDMAEAMQCFKKEFRPPGWGLNLETYTVLIERGYRICDHLGHDRWEELGGERYTTGHLMECHGHTWECNSNGIKELTTTKCNFGDNTEFLFISEAPLDTYLPGRYQ